MYFWNSQDERQSFDHFLKTKIILLVFVFFIINVHSQALSVSLKEDIFICKQCGKDLSAGNLIQSIVSPFAKRIVNETFYGHKILVQELENPANIRFDVFIVRKAECAPTEHWIEKGSWFPGFAWKICYCPQCSTHLGWMFEPNETATKDRTFPSLKGFYVLRISTLVTDSFLNSLLAKPVLGEITHNG